MTKREDQRIAALARKNAAKVKPQLDKLGMPVEVVTAR